MILFKVKYTGAVPSVARQALGRIKRESWRQTGEHWHGRYRPKHFRRSGAREYGYAPRTGEPGSSNPKGGYMRRKRREKGHSLPLVWSGTSRQLTRLRDVRATSKGARVVMNAPGLNRRHPKSRINMRDEMTRISVRERTQLTKVLDGGLDRRLRQIRTRRTRKAK